MDGVIDVSCGDVFTDDRDHSFTAVVLEDGSLWTQGVNDNGQLGDGTIENRYELVKIMDDAVSVSLGGNHSAAIKEDGSLWTWGSNYAGKLGRATSTVEERIVPGRVPGFGGVGSDPAPEPVSGSMHRLYNPWTGEHFYTLSTVERDSLVSVGWEYEGEGWVAPSQGAEVYRLYNPYVEGGDHHYTLSAFERDSLVRAGWRYEGVGWYSASDADGNPVTGAVPLWRQYNPYAATGTHNYTTSEVERDSLVAAGWLPEGVAWYGIG